MTNEILSNETVDIETSSGDKLIAIELTVSIDAPSLAEPFVADAMQAFLMQRMVSPPETNALFITVMGEIQPNEFGAIWNAHARANDAVSAFMSRMTVADVIGYMRDAPKEQVRVSLLG